MVDEETPSQEEREFLSQGEFESMWTQARRKAGLAGKSGGSRDLYIYPILILYSGFFFGPFGTALMAVATLKWRVQLRLAGILFGIAGTTWFAIIGFTEFFLPVWGPYELQFGRSTFNFICGVSCYIAIRLQIRETHTASRQTLHRTIAATIVLVSLFFIIPPSLHLTLGR